MMLQWEDSRVCAMDCETSGVQSEYALQPWRHEQGKMWITSFAYVWKEGREFKDAGGLATPYERPDDELTKDMIAEFFRHVRERGQCVVGSHIAYDISLMLAYGFKKEVFETKWLSTDLMWRHWFVEPEYEVDRPRKKSYGLKAWVAEFLPQLSNYADDVDFHDPSPEARAKLHRYNVRDDVATWVMAKDLFVKLQDYPDRLRAMLIEADCLPMVAEANLRGMPVDTLYAKELSGRLQITAAEKLQVLAPFGVNASIVRSPTKLAKLLFDEWGLPVLKRNDVTAAQKAKGIVEGNRSTDKETLHELSFLDPRAKELHEYRGALNQNTKFAVAPLTSAEYNENGRVHPQFSVFSTYSGRGTYQSAQTRKADKEKKIAAASFPIGFAVHQEKREKFFREVLIAPPGYTIVERDAAGQEFRWMAVASGDEVMQSLCQPGEDPHSFMGSSIVRKDYRQLIIDAKVQGSQEEQDRYLGKFANLSCQYRTGKKKLRSKARVDYGIPLTPDEAAYIHATYQKTYPGVPEYWKAEIARVKRQGYQETFAGRRVQVVGNWDGEWGWSMGSTSINYKIQGTGADQKYLALQCLQPLMARYDARFFLDLHDGLYFFVPDAYVRQFYVASGHILDNLPYKEAWGFTPPVPMPWDGKVGKVWGAMKEPDWD